MEQKFTVKKVIFNAPATIVFWEDGSKTVVKAHHEAFDPEKGVALCFMKKALGNKSNYNNVLKSLTGNENAEISDDVKAVKEVLNTFNFIVNPLHSGEYAVISRYGNYFPQLNYSYKWDKWNCFDTYDQTQVNKNAFDIMCWKELSDAD